MSDVMIRVENLSKRYVIGYQFEGAGYVTLRDRLSDGARSLMNRRNIARSPGMSRSPIKAKFDKIVDFVGVEKFLDTSRRYE